MSSAAAPSEPSGRQGAAPLALAARALWRRRRGIAAWGVAMSLAAVLTGAALFGLAGWWIGAAALGGAAVGAAASLWALRAAAIGLALGRAAARYAERLGLHDATLSFLAWLRGRLFETAAAAPWRAMLRLRRGVALSRLTADVDALDGLYIRILAPTLAAAAGLAAVGAAVLVAAPSAAVAQAALIAVAVLAGGGALAMALGARQGDRPARRRAAALEAVRVRFVDLQAARAELAASGRIVSQRASIVRAAAAARDAAADQRRLDLGLGALSGLAAALAAALAFWVAAEAGAGLVGVALATILALALPEAVAPLRRAGLEIGRTRLAARRAAPALAEAEDAAPAAAEAPAGARAEAPLLAVEDARAARAAPVSFAARRGEVVGLHGPSGAGKSTLLAAIAGLDALRGGRIALRGAAIETWSEPALRAQIGVLPQRVELLAGTLGDNLRLAAPDAPDETLWAALEAADGAEAARRAGGLSARVEDGGTGFSGGETRRIALARLLLRRPALALLDEPTEGLDAETAERALQGALDWLQGSAVIVASHRPADLARADRIVRIAAA